MKTRYCLFTNDVETTSIWHNSLRDKTGKRVLLEGMPLLLKLYEKYNIKSTFFFTGYIVKLYPEIVKMVVPYGHEVASHGMSHIKSNGFDIMPLVKQIRHLKESKKMLEDICGQEVISFRAPALRINKNTALALIEAGYRIDSSIASQRFDMFMSFGGLKKLNWLTANRLPYKTSENSLFNRGGGPLIEVPLSAILFPYVGTTMRIFPYITRIQKNILNWETSVNKKPIVFDIHPNEFIEEFDEPRTISRRSKNLLSYFFQDYLRSHLKVRNLGTKAISLYESEILFFKKRNYKFTTIKDYCIKTDLSK